MLFCLFKHYLDTDTALKVSQSLYCFTTSISHDVENYSPGCGVQASLILFYSTDFKDSADIIFTHGIQIGRWVAGKSLSGLYLRNYEL